MKPEWGSRRTCIACQSSFYDMNREPITCPRCQKKFGPDKVNQKMSTELNNVIEDSEEDLTRAKVGSTVPYDEIVASMPLHMIKRGDNTEYIKRGPGRRPSAKKTEKITLKVVSGEKGKAGKNSKASLKEAANHPKKTTKMPQKSSEIPPKEVGKKSKKSQKKAS